MNGTLRLKEGGHAWHDKDRCKALNIILTGDGTFRRSRAIPHQTPPNRERGDPLNKIVNGLARLRRCVRRIMRSEKGATAIEYGLIAYVVAIAITAAGVLLGEELVTAFTNIKNTLASVNTPPV